EIKNSGVGTVFPQYVKQSVDWIRPFDEYPERPDDTKGKRKTNFLDDKLRKIYGTLTQKYKQGLADDLYALAHLIDKAVSVKR
ncbi:MAG: hypothetical protein LBV70_06395, partial [Candidatus Adiutrix sp.]|nr:hypothetical protein [Candidatus Adiutrix sp.]